MARAGARGDFGTSFQNRVAVGPEILKRLPVTLELAIFAFLIANLIAIPLGALAAFYHQRTADTAITFLATVFGAIPNFWLATLAGPCFCTNFALAACRRLHAA